MAGRLNFGGDDMIITVDIGNTNITFGGFTNDEPTFIANIATDTHRTDCEYAVKIRSILNLYSVDKNSVSGAVISSVVPPLTAKISSALKMIYGIDSLVVSPGIKTGINLMVDNPAQVGADLICSCVAAYNLYNPPVLIVDMGTATKIHIVDENACFHGVSIIPGVEISLKALAGGTAQLPQISLEAPERILGKNTIDSMRSGVVYGYASMVDEMITRVEKETGKQFELVATGGLSSAIIPYCKHKITLDKILILKGLLIIYKKNFKTKLI